MDLKYIATIAASEAPELHLEKEANDASRDFCFVQRRGISKTQSGVDRGVSVFKFAFLAEQRCWL